MELELRHPSVIEQFEYTDENGQNTIIAAASELAKQEIQNSETYATSDNVYTKSEVDTSLSDCLTKTGINNGWNVIVTGNQIRCSSSFSPSSTNSGLNFASLGTVRNFYNDILTSYITPINSQIGDIETLLSSI